MTSPSKRMVDSPSAGAISLGRLLFVAAFTVLAVAAASLWAFEGRGDTGTIATV